MTKPLRLLFLISFFLMQSVFLLQDLDIAQAEKLRAWTDKNGVIHITDAPKGDDTNTNTGTNTSTSTSTNTVSGDSPETATSSDTVNSKSKKITLPPINTNKTSIIWAITLALPILIRFVFLRHPLPKIVALISLVFIWLINSAVFRALDVANKTNVTLLLLSYLILCKGYKKYKRSQARRQREEEKDSQGFGQKNEKAKTKEENENNKAGPRTKKQAINSEKDYEDTLGLGGTYTVEDIKRCYRELVLKYHPDKVNHLGDKLKETADLEIKKIYEAYAYFKKKKGFK